MEKEHARGEVNEEETASENSESAALIACPAWSDKSGLDIYRDFMDEDEPPPKFVRRDPVKDRRDMKPDPRVKREFGDEEEPTFHEQEEEEPADQEQDGPPAWGAPPPWTGLDDSPISIVFPLLESPLLEPNEPLTAIQYYDILNDINRTRATIKSSPHLVTYIEGINERVMNMIECLGIMVEDVERRLSRERVRPRRGRSILRELQDRWEGSTGEKSDKEVHVLKLLQALWKDGVTDNVEMLFVGCLGQILRQEAGTAQ